MQLKGLVRFFTILLILFSLYQLSFTWFVNNHEKKMEARAEKYVKTLPTAEDKYSQDAEKKLLYADTLISLRKNRLKELLDSTKDTKVTWWGNSYKKARESELNLGLDLQGGMNVTLEVELAGLLKSLSSNSKDPNFLKALENANQRKANTDADFITLFSDEYKKLNPNGRLASIFASGNKDDIKLDASDAQVLSFIRTQSKTAINNTYRILTNRIDQFGLAQPGINLEEDKGIITVELPGVNDEERVRNYLQASANLQFWETYKPEELSSGVEAANTAYTNYTKGISNERPDTTQVAPAPATPEKNPDTTVPNKSGTPSLADQSGGGSTQPTLGDTSNNNTAKPLFGGWISNPVNGATIGSVLIRDTSRVRTFLELGGVRKNFPADAKFAYGIPEKAATGITSNVVGLYVLRTYGNEVAPLEGDNIASAGTSFDNLSGKPKVVMDMKPAGRTKWAALTKRSYDDKRPIAIVLDDKVYSAPTAFNGPIEGGNTEISGTFDLEEATDLSNILKAGKLPAPAKIVQEQVVGPTLGQKAIQGGSMAFLISFIVIFILMLVYYNTAGWVANIALILNLLFTVSILAAFGATLTAPGIAGLVLTIGMAVDTNVIIYERIKEELTRGKSYLQSINDGYRRSLPPVLDAHVTTLLTAIILFNFGLGPVKGFATTQIIGILLSLFCGILVSRWVTEWFTNKNRHLEYFTGISKKIFKHANFKFIEYRKYAYIISAVVLLLGVGAIINGFDEGVEFSGGRSYEVDFQKPVNNDVEKIRDDLKAAFGESPVIKTIGSNTRLDITTSYKIDANGPGVDSLVMEKLIQGLKNYLPEGTTYGQFNTKYKLGAKKILPTISDDLKRGAIWAAFWSILIITIYIFIRFRDWRYSLGTIFALLHDVFIALAVFSFVRGHVPFPLEIDQHFIAAILTVIGFSMNDTVIVFDRIREYSNEMRNANKETIINRAINDTLSRTIMTSLTVFLVILILFIFGGEVTRGFAFAMLIGIITGTYSSIFVAAPILVDMAKSKPLGKADEVVVKK